MYERGGTDLSAAMDFQSRRRFISFSTIDPCNLTDYGVEVRYPGDFLEPSLKEIQTLIPIVENIRDHVLMNLPVIPPRNR